MSRIALGLMRLDFSTAGQVEKLIEESLKMGIDKFDLADIYGNGHSEKLVGEVLKKRPELRQKMYIQTKVGIVKGKGYDLSHDYIVEHTKQCIQRIGCGYLDCLLLHRPDILMDNEEIAQAIAELQEQGLVKDFGVSNFSPSEILYLEDTLKTPILYNQVQLGLGNTTMLDQTMYTNIPSKIVSKESDSLLFFLKRKKITIQCWSPYQMGLFGGSIFNELRFPKLNAVLNKYAQKYNTSKCAIATAFLLAVDKNLWVITGSTNLKHIAQSLDGEKVPLSKMDWYDIYRQSGKMLP